jgi:hypothetical protein
MELQLALSCTSPASFAAASASLLVTGVLVTVSVAIESTLGLSGVYGEFIAALK